MYDNNLIKDKTTRCGTMVVVGYSDENSRYAQKMREDIVKRSFFPRY